MVRVTDGTKSTKVSIVAGLLGTDYLRCNSVTRYACIMAETIDELAMTIFIQTKEYGLLPIGGASRPPRYDMDTDSKS